MSTSRKGKGTNGVNSHKLSDHVVPLHYTIREEPNFGTFMFDGTIEIDIDVRKAVSSFQMHTNGLKITKAWVEDKNGTRLDALTTQGSVTWSKPGTDASGKATFLPYKEEFTSAATVDEKSQRATFNFAGTLGVGQWKFFAQFAGTMVQPSLEGFYLADWTDDAGAKHYIGTTQFEATHARRAFPCFDEPALKATYDVTLVVDEHLTALSNSRVKSITAVEGGKKVVEFKTTPKQSTYLVAWCIGEFESSEPVFANGKEIRVWSIPGQNNLKSYALKCAAYGVKWYERKFRVPYFGGDKIDMIAIPNFRSGAMENTGLITYRATALLVDELKATVAELQRVAEVVFHELAHQWCGNLVTMLWWDGLPLNESNATIFAYLVMDDFEPGWHIFNAFGIDRNGAFEIDSLLKTHACWKCVGHPDEVEELFDPITYEKGGSVEYQMMRFAGLDKFLEGMHIYLSRYSHGNAEVTDLWDAIEEGVRKCGADISAREIMDAWFFNEGHPVVTVSQSGKPGFIKLHQERFTFVADGKDGSENGKDQLWPIPVHIRYATADGEIREEKFLFSGREQEVFIEKDFKWVVANAGGSGFYRVRYSQELLDRLLAEPFENLKVIERYSLINDSWALVRAQLLSSDTYLGVVKKLAGETDPHVWTIVSESLKALHKLTSREQRAAFKALVRELTKPVFDELGWTPKEGETSATLELRGKLAELLGTIGEEASVQAKAAELFDAWKKDRSSVDPNVLPALVATLAHTGNKARFDEFVALAKAAKTDQEKLRFLRALGRFQVPELYKAAIDMMIAEVKTDDAPLLIGSYLTLDHAAEATWDMIRENWQIIQDKFPNSGTVRMLGNCSNLDTPELEAEVKEFFSKNEVKQGKMAVAQMLERLSVNVRLRSTETPKLHAFLKPATKSGAGEEKAVVAAASDKK